MALQYQVQLPVTWLIVGLVTAYVLARRVTRRSRYPPGPRGLPLIRNLFDVPVDDAWIKYQEMGTQCGSDIIHLQALNMHVVVINSSTIAHELLEKRSSIYSSRQHSVMLSELSGWIRDWAFWQYGDGWRKHRRFFTEHFRPELVPGYYAKQVKGVDKLLRNLLDSPEEFREHIRLLTTATILDIIYGFHIEAGDPLIELVQQAMNTLNEFMNTGVYLVDVITWLKFLPSWLPGTGFQRQAARWRTLVYGMYDEPYRMFKTALHEGTAEPCFTSVLLAAAEGDKWDDLDESVVSVTGTTYGAGEDTTKTSLSAFVLALTLFPEAQVAAQQELDRVLSRKRLPTIEDQAALPQVTAVVLELLRWHCVVPLGISHLTTADDEYGGYFIPAGSVVIGNSWAMLHDPSAFPDPERFDPSRFLATDGSLRSDAPSVTPAFGFGRRICPGRHFARDFLWLAIANILAVFSIRRAIDEDGKEVETRAEFSSRVFRSPLPFKCHIAPRFPEAEGLISEAADNGRA
ncbi:cytochrome P450 [Phanerochaete sordida]|uniref:Cytochrome P450 n=1 Tax=Phanerochaete sordida TaxID=48140 RepID=A0A9P3GID0_9APHY|nr:cytochrome P450 [Phanerochaete sordida]